MTNNKYNRMIFKIKINLINKIVIYKQMSKQIIYNKILKMNKKKKLNSNKAKLKISNQIMI